jgi:hypothetical protein
MHIRASIGPTMPRTPSILVCATLLFGTIAIGCGDPKGAAGAIGAPVKQKVEQKVAPQDSRTVKLNPEVPDAQQKVTPVAPAEAKVLEATPVAPIDQKVQ